MLTHLVSKTIFVNSKEKLILYTLAAVNFTHIMDFMILMPMGPQLMKLFSITPAQFSFAVSAYSLTAGISGFCAAFFVDKFDRKQVLLYAYIGFIIGTFSCAFAGSYEMLVAARILAGLFGGLIGAQVLSIVGDMIPFEKRGEAMGIVMTAFSLAAVLGVPAGLWLASHYSWHWPFLVIGGLGLFVIVLIWLYFPSITKHITEKKEGQSPWKVLADIYQSPRQLWALLLTSTAMIGHFIIIPLITPSLVANANFSTDNVFLIYLVGGFLTIFTSRMIGKLADQKGKYPIFVLFAFLSFIPILLITHIQAYPLWIILSISSLFFVFANGRTVSIQAMVSDVVPAQQRGGFMSINSSLQQLASGIAANLGGFIVYNGADGHLYNYNYVGFVAVGFLIIAIYAGSRSKGLVD
jgi:MFS transporter, DHA1 family, inner membrane transport protein